MSCLAQGRMIPSDGGVVPTDPMRPLTRVAGSRPHACAWSTERCSLTNGRSEEKTCGPEQSRAETSGPMQSKGWWRDHDTSQHAGGSPAQTSRGCCACPWPGPDLHPDCEPGSKGTGMCAGGTTTANSDSREGVWSGLGNN